MALCLLNARAIHLNTELVSSMLDVTTYCLLWHAIANLNTMFYRTHVRSALQHSVARRNSLHPRCSRPRVTHMPLIGGVWGSSCMRYDNLSQNPFRSGLSQDLRLIVSHNNRLQSLLRCLSGRPHSLDRTRSRYRKNFSVFPILLVDMLSHQWCRGHGLRIRLSAGCCSSRSSRPL
jgi:hypothetical protein